MGARPMRRIIQSEIEDEIANRLLADDTRRWGETPECNTSGVQQPRMGTVDDFGADTVIIDYRDEKITIELERDKEIKSEGVLQLA
jgi:ATP-dependent Clp protease ATP-binding subunit ClpA